MVKHPPALPPERIKYIHRAAQKLLKQQAKWRRHLHQHPELSFQELDTTAFVRTELKKLGVGLRKIDMKTGVLGELKGSGRGRTVAVRSDMDALPVTERTGLPFASRRPGCMHACGHDAHMSIVLGVAAILADGNCPFEGQVRFIFQPGEEQPPGGARPMIANGALENVSMIFGLHAEPQLPTGHIGLRDGPTMAAVYDFNLIIKGKGGHAARPHLAVDPIVTAAEVIESLQTVISRECDPTSPSLITFGKIEGGTARNVIADTVYLTGTARTLSPKDFKRIPRLIKRTVDGVCKARGATADLEQISDYPVLRNSPAANRVLAENARTLFGAHRLAETELTLGGEDFACYLEHVPGAMFRLGTRNKKLKSDRSWHSPEFTIDEAAMPAGSALLAAAVLQTLGA